MNTQVKMWRDMTPEEKGALLLAAHEGKRIETLVAFEWVKKGHGGWGAENVYRVKPEPAPPREFWIAPNPYHQQGFHVVGSKYPGAIHVREVLE